MPQAFSVPDRPLTLRGRPGVEMTMAEAGYPPSQGLYDPALEHDSCGFGFVADIKGRPSHEIVVKALEVLLNLEHRGATGGARMRGASEEEPASPATGGARTRGASEEEPASPATGGARMRGASEEEPASPAT